VRNEVDPSGMYFHTFLFLCPSYYNFTWVKSNGYERGKNIGKGDNGYN